MEDLLYVLDVLVEETQRRRVREHQPGRPLVHELPEMRNVEVAALVRLDLRELVAGHRDARRVRAVCGVSRDDGVALVAFRSVVEVRAHEHEASQLTLASRRRLQRACMQA